MTPTPVALLRWLLLCSLGLFMTGSSVAATTVLTDTQAELQLSTHLDFLHDPSGQLTIHEVSSPAYQQAFRNTGDAPFAQGFTQDAFWLRVHISNPSSAWQQWYAKIHDMEESPLHVYWLPDAPNAAPQLLKPEPHFHHHLYPLPLSAHPEAWLYVRLQGSVDSLTASIGFVPKEKRININRLVFDTAILAGSCALALYHFLLFLSGREQGYGWLSLSMLFTAVEMSRYTGLMAQYVGIYTDYYRLYPAFALLAISSYLIFFKHFLQLKQCAPRINRVFNGLVWLNLVFLLSLPWFAYGAVFSSSSVLLAIITSLITLTYLHLKGKKIPTSLYVAFFLLLSGIFPITVDAFGLRLINNPDSHLIAVIAIFLFLLLLSNAQTDQTRRLREQAARAKAASQAKSEFLATMSHELRTPMNAVVGATHLLRSTHLTTNQADYLTKLDIAAHHMLMLIGNVLDISRIERQEITLVNLPFDLQALLATLESLFIAQTRAKGLVLQLRVPTQPLWLKGDAVKLKQVLINLLENALKFTQQGHIDLNVTLGSMSGDALTVTFSVTDTGVGIAAAQQTRIFQAFVQLHNANTQHLSGSGLGLAVSAELVRAMGGELRVTSQLGQGSCFYFTLCLAVAEPEQAPLTASDLHLPAADILLVDDDDNTSDSLRSDSTITTKVCKGLGRFYGTEVEL